MVKCALEQKRSKQSLLFVHINDPGQSLPGRKLVHNSFTNKFSKTT